MKNMRKFGVIFLLLFGLILVVSSIYKHSAKASDSLTTASPINQTPIIESNYLNQFSSKILPSGNALVPIANIQALINNQAFTKQAALSPSLPTTTYTVVSGDTLWNIANTYNITVEQLVAMNNLNNVALSIGQEIIVSGQAQIKTSSVSQKATTPSRSAQPSQAGAILQLATHYLNTPYRWGGTTPGGFDCSGFVQYVYGRFGYRLPRTAAEQATVGVRVDKANLMPGDLVFFAYNGPGISHVGIYAGNGSYINASTPYDGGVIYSSLSANSRSYAGARRILR